MSIGERIRRARIDKGLTQPELAELCGWGHTQGRVSHYETGRRDVSTSDVIRIARALDVDVSHLLVPTGSTQPNTTPGPDVKGYVPLISWVQAGEWSEATDLFSPGDAEQAIPCPASHGLHSYALRVEGDSMTAATGKSYPSGSIIFVDPDQRGGVRPGDRVIAKLDGSDQVTFKQLAEDRQGLYLKPLNPAYPDVFGEFKILGKVVGKWEAE